jgi:hypothetical protein
MAEVFPVLAGIVVGLATHQLASGAWRAMLIVVGSLGLGALATWIAGELAVSWVYVLIDAGQVALAAVLTVVAVTVWRRRALRVRS